MKVLKADQRLEEFDPEKFKNSLLKSGATKDLAEEIASHIQTELRDGMSTSQIYKHASFLLKKKFRKVEISYSLRKAVMELGPTGFPFERFIGEIFEEKGYEVKVGEMLKGNCAEHELDVVAFNENKLIITEAKYHNGLGIKSDIKTALYVKARFDDLKDGKYFFGKERKVDENWLITNTKFTSSATKYGSCVGIHMVSWNYPAKGNLQDIIEDSGLHPITCLESLSTHQKRALLSQNIVLCRKLRDNYEAMKSAGLSNEEIEEVGKEIALISD